MGYTHAQESEISEVIGYLTDPHAEERYLPKLNRLSRVMGGPDGYGDALCNAIGHILYEGTHPQSITAVLAMPREDVICRITDVLSGQISDKIMKHLQGTPHLAALKRTASTFSNTEADDLLVIRDAIKEGIQFGTLGCPLGLHSADTITPDELAYIHELAETTLQRHGGDWIDKTCRERGIFGRRSGMSLD